MIRRLNYRLNVYRTFGDNGREDFRAVSGIIRLANKYDIDKLRRQALEHISVAWPTTLKSWDAREDLARMFELESGMQQGFRYPSPIVRDITFPCSWPVCISANPKIGMHIYIHSCDRTCWLLNRVPPIHLGGDLVWFGDTVRSIDLSLSFIVYTAQFFHPFYHDRRDTG